MVSEYIEDQRGGLNHGCGIEKNFREFLFIACDEYASINMELGHVAYFEISANLFNMVTLKNVPQKVFIVFCIALKPNTFLE